MIATASDGITAALKGQRCTNSTHNTAASEPHGRRCSTTSRKQLLHLWRLCSHPRLAELTLCMHLAENNLQYNRSSFKVSARPCVMPHRIDVPLDGLQCNPATVGMGGEDEEATASVLFCHCLHSRHCRHQSRPALTKYKTSPAILPAILEWEQPDWAYCWKESMKPSTGREIFLLKMFSR